MPEGIYLNYLRQNGTIRYSIDPKFNFSLTELFFEGWYETSVCLWPKNSKMRFNFLQLERTPPSRPSISLSSESGIDIAL